MACTCIKLLTTLTLHVILHTFTLSHTLMTGAKIHSAGRPISSQHSWHSHNGSNSSSNVSLKDIPTCVSEEEPRIVAPINWSKGGRVPPPTHVSPKPMPTVNVANAEWPRQMQFCAIELWSLIYLSVRVNKSVLNCIWILSRGTWESWS